MLQTRDGDNSPGEEEEIPTNNHSGVNKTRSRILQHFYWPKIRRDVLQYCRTCQIKFYLATDIHRHIYMYNHIYIDRLYVNNKCIICTYDIAVAWCCLA